MQESNLDMQSLISSYRLQFREIYFALAIGHTGRIFIHKLQDEEYNSSSQLDSGSEYLFDKYKEIKDWFDTRICLATDDNVQYFNKFIEHGYDTFDVIILIDNEKQLVEMGIVKKGHILHFLREIQLLRNNPIQNETYDNIESDENVKMALINEIIQIENTTSDNNDNDVFGIPLIQEIIRNENEYIKKHAGGNQNNSRPRPINKNHSNNDDDNKQNPNDDDGNNRNDSGNDDEKNNNDDEKKDDNDNDNDNVYDISDLLSRLEVLKKHRKYHIMSKNNQGLQDSELLALIYYTDSNSVCNKMKLAHRKLSGVTKWKQLYFHATNAVIKMHRTFHYQNNQQTKICRLYHGSTIVALDKLSQQALFVKTLLSFSAQFEIAKSLATGSILVVDDVYKGLYDGRLKGADIQWISKFDEKEYVLLPTTFYEWKQMSKQDIVQNRWIVGIHVKIYIATSYISNNNPLLSHGDTILPKVQIVYDELRNDMYEKFKDVKQWFDNKVCCTKQDNLKYFQLFIDNGFDTFEIIKEMSQDDLKDIGIVKLGHRKKLCREIQKLKTYEK